MISRGELERRLQAVPWIHGPRCRATTCVCDPWPDYPALAETVRALWEKETDAARRETWEAAANNARHTRCLGPCSDDGCAARKDLEEQYRARAELAGRGEGTGGWDRKYDGRKSELLYLIMHDHGNCEACDELERERDALRMEKAALNFRYGTDTMTHPAALDAARRETWEAAAKIAEDEPRRCGGSRVDGDTTLWREPISHSDAHDSCHEALDIARRLWEQAAALTTEKGKS